MVRRLGKMQNRSNKNDAEATVFTMQRKDLLELRAKVEEESHDREIYP